MLAADAEFSPLEIDLDLGTALPGLAEAIASGEQIPAVQLVGVTGEGNTVYDLRLNDALVSDYTDADTGPDHLAFSYQTISLTTTPGDGLGGLGAPTVFGWDSVVEAETDEGSSATPSSDDADGGGSLTYYLLIDGMNGGSNSALYPGAFEIDGYAIDIEALVAGRCRVLATGDRSRSRHGPSRACRGDRIRRGRFRRSNWSASRGRAIPSTTCG